MQKDDFNDILKQQASGFEIKPEAGSFEKMMQQRAMKKTAMLHRRRRITIAWSIAASVAVLSLAGVLLFNSFDNSNRHIVNNIEISSDIQSSSEQLQENNLRSGEPAPQLAVQPEKHAPTAIARYNKQQNNPVRQDIPAPAGGESLTSVVQAKAIIKPGVSVLSENNTSVSQTTVTKQNNGIPRVETDAINKENKITGPVNQKYPEPAVALSDKPLEIKLSTPLDAEHLVAVPILISDSSVSQQQTIASVPDSVIPETRASKQGIEGYKWSVAAMFTPQLVNSVYNANSDATLRWMKQYLENRAQNDQALYSFNTGLKLERKLSNHFSISAGVLYSTVKFEEIRRVNTLVPDTNEGELGIAEINRDSVIKEVDRNSFDISFNSLEIPVQFYYTMQRKKMFYQAMVGVSYSYLFKTRSLVFDINDSLNVKETNDARNERLRQHSILLLGGIHVGMNLNKRWSCYAGPAFRYSVNSIYSKDYIIRQQPYFVGAEMGVKYSF